MIERLRADVERNRIAYYDASRIYNALVDEIPSGLPHPDGHFQLAQAGERFRKALRAYAEAVRKLDDFVLNGGKGGAIG